MIKVKVVGHANAFTDKAELHENSGLLYYPDKNEWTTMIAEVSKGKRVFTFKEEPIKEEKVEKEVKPKTKKGMKPKDEPGH